jgi:hypothetical protein
MPGRLIDRLTANKHGMDQGVAIKPCAPLKVRQTN